MVIWIAKEFRDEHRAALDLLNRRTSEDAEFFGVEIELCAIDGSRPAPNFKLVATPNEWGKKAGRGNASDTNTTERDEKYRAFWQGLVDTIREHHKFTNIRKGPAQSWCNFATGYPGTTYGVSFAQGRRARVEVYIDRQDGDWNKGLFDRLYEQKDSIESALGESLEWQRLEERRACRIAAITQASIDDDQEALDTTKV